MSFWFKQGSQAATASRGFSFGSGDDASNRWHFYIETDGQFYYYGKLGGSVNMTINSTPMYRDSSAWYHYCLAIDTTQGTAANRVRTYINNVEVTSYVEATYPSQNDNCPLVKGADMQIGAIRGGSYQIYNYADCYMAEVCFIDGQQLTPSSFGEFDEDSPTIWKPIDVSGLTFGTNGYYLDFEDSANLGNDANGGTDFTETNLAATDQCTDTPTNNFCTLNPLDNYYQQATFSEGNCKVVTEGSSAVYAFVTGTIGLTAGKWYFEMKMTNSTGGGGSFYGVAAELATSASTELGHTSNQIGLMNANSTRTGDAVTSFGGTAYTTGDVMMCALDMTNSRIFFGMNGTWMQPGSATGGDPTDGTGAVALPTAVASTPIGAYLPAFGSYMNAAQTMEPNFGNPSFSITSAVSDANGYGKFEFTVPSGYLAICTKNLGSDGG